MYFHIIGIKEVDNQKYNVDIVLEAESDTIVRDFLHSKNIVILNFVQYKGNINDFGNIEFWLKDFEISKFFTYAQDLYSAIKYFMKIGLNISYANFLTDDKKSDLEIYKLIEKAKDELIQSENTNKKNSQQKNQLEDIYDNERLNKTIETVHSAMDIIDDTLTKLPIQQLSMDKIRSLQAMYQELNKLKMGRNLDKMEEVLAKTYQTIFDIQKEFLSKQEPSLLFQGSTITDVDMQIELQKYHKAQNIKNLGTKKNIVDRYYIFLKKTGIFSKLLFKDLATTSANISQLLYSLYDYLDFFFVFILSFFSLYFWFHKISYSLYQNLYLYYFVIQLGVFAFVFSIIKIFRKQSAKINLRLLIFAFVLSSALFFIIKNNLSF